MRGMELIGNGVSAAPEKSYAGGNKAMGALKDAAHVALRTTAFVAGGLEKVILVAGPAIAGFFVLDGLGAAVNPRGCGSHWTFDHRWMPQVLGGETCPRLEECESLLYNSKGSRDVNNAKVVQEMFNCRLGVYQSQDPVIEGERVVKELVARLAILLVVTPIAAKFCSGIKNLANQVDKLF